MDQAQGQADHGTVSTATVRAFAESVISEVPDGAGLDAVTRVLIEVALSSSVTALDVSEVHRKIEAALDLGADARQIQDVLTLVSGLGVHTLFESSRRLLASVRARGAAADVALTDEQRRLWDRHVGAAGSYWTHVENEVPGFLESLLRLSPETFEAFFIYCAVPWRSAALPRLTLELISLAVDSAPTHRYLPGCALHLRNALDLGAGAASIRQTLDIAADAPGHGGVGRSS